MAVCGTDTAGFVSVLDLRVPQSPGTVFVYLINMHQTYTIKGGRHKIKIMTWSSGKTLVFWT